MIASECIPALIDRMLESGATFDDAVKELREQIGTACDNRHEYEERN
jgi:hypothetical protein